MSTAQRPLNLGEILDRTIQLYRRNIVLFAGIAALPSAIWVGFWMGVFPAIQAQSQAGKSPGGTQGMILALELLGAFVVGIPITTMADAFRLGATSRAALSVNQGESFTVRAGYRYALRNFGRLLWLLLLVNLFSWTLPIVGGVGLAVVGGIASFAGGGNGRGPFIAVVAFVTLAILISGFWIWIRYALAFPITVTEGLRARDSMKRSSSLSSGVRWRIFVLLLLVYVLNLAVMWIMQLPADLAINYMDHGSMVTHVLSHSMAQVKLFVTLGIGFVVRIFVQPLYAIALILIYFDQRIRAEGYDIEMLMAQAGWSGLAAVEAQPSAPPLPEVTGAEESVS